MTENFRTFDQRPRDSFARPCLLIVDDDANWRSLVRAVLEKSLEDQRITVLDCGGIAESIEILSSQIVHAIILDKNLGPREDIPSQNGISSVPQLLGIQKHVQIVMATGSTDIQDVVEAMKNGAAGYVVKHQNMELFVELVKKALRDGVQGLRVMTETEREESARNDDLVGNSQAIHLLRSRVHEMAKADAPVLFLGESGVGKTTAARLLHHLRGQYLRQTNRPFIHLNMAAIPDLLAEAELFGAEAGAFTDAKKPRIGAIKQADGGTLFLDEIGDAPLALQAKLLTALDGNGFRSVGGSKDIQSDFRLICATNRNLEQMIREKKFREDLYRRISIIEIRVPSLKDRSADIADIVRAVLPKCCSQTRIYVDFEDIPKDFIAHLAANPPIGNIGGIEQQLSRLLLFSPRDKKDQPILKQWKHIEGMTSSGGTQMIHSSFEDFMSKPFDIVGKPGFPGIRKFLDEIEKKIYEDARRKFGSTRGASKQIAVNLKASPSVVSGRLTYFRLTLADSKEKQSKERRLHS